NRSKGSANRSRTARWSSSRVSSTPSAPTSKPLHGCTARTSKRTPSSVCTSKRCAATLVSIPWL
ncbi:hypothetical protein BGZ52_000601, partial [Haplosporangium bisporale]